MHPSLYKSFDFSQEYDKNQTLGLHDYFHQVHHNFGEK